LLNTFIRVRVRDVVFANDDLRVYPGLVDVAEHLDNPANRAAGSRWPAGGLNGKHIVRFRSAALSGWDMNVCGYAAIKRHRIRKSRSVRFETADDGVVR